MTDDDKLSNFINLDKPTLKQVIEILKIWAKRELKITDDGYEINSLTGERSKKITTTPVSIDENTDEKIMAEIAKTEVEKVKTQFESLSATIKKIKTALKKIGISI